MNTAARPPCPAGPNRRGFLQQVLATGIGAVSGAVPLGAALTVLLAPLRRPSAAGATVQVANLGAIPADGTPERFPVVATRIDAWNQSQGIIGAVYLRRVGSAVHALNVACPHAGCFVEYSPNRAGFHCPCHHSSFSLDGQLSDVRSPAPRAMDALEVEIRNGTEVWVAFRNFRAGEARKVAL